ncbi:MAG: indole-3-glycerol phosphate synthase TrpC [Syntrophales bacterium]|jgi:indole-3-glycerol phosphate synthase|nr:indole-3-glycerol phosphate synthase TrpC [Syntrophales bacterium]
MKETTFLDRIVETKREELAATKRLAPLREMQAILCELPPPRNFQEALTGRDCAIIAEIKKASPSRGIIREDFDPLKIAAIYEDSGAEAISVLTESVYFKGDGRYLSAISKIAGIPLLRKDFIIDPYQIFETRVLGGDALLLIARLLSREALAEYIALTVELDMTPLVEVHDEGELEKSLAAGAKVIGINNRNLDTFVTDLGTSLKLAPLIPAGIVKISESGIAGRQDVETLQRAGIHAFLIGETLMRSADIGGKLRELSDT